MKRTGRLSAPALVRLLREMLEIKLTQKEGEAVVKNMASGENIEDGFIDLDDFERAIEAESPQQSDEAPEMEDGAEGGAPGGSDDARALRALELIAQELAGLNVPLSAIFVAFDTDGDKQIDRNEFEDGECDAIFIQALRLSGHILKVLVCMV